MALPLRRSAFKAMSAVTSFRNAYAHRYSACSSLMLQETSSRCSSPRPAIIGLLDLVGKLSFPPPRITHVEDDDDPVTMLHIRPPFRPLLQNKTLLRQRVVSWLSEMGKTKDCIPLKELFSLVCDQVSSKGASHVATAEDVVQSLEKSGHILIFNNNVFLHPEKVSAALSRSMPFPLSPDDDIRKAELQRLQQEKEAIDKTAQKQVRWMLRAGFAGLSTQFIFFSWLTFWELSWDVIEPVMFFLTSAGVTTSFSFFLITSKGPSLRGLMLAMLQSKSQTLIRRRNFNMERFEELQRLS